MSATEVLEEAEEAPRKGRSTWLLIGVLVLLLAVAAAVWFLVLAPDGAEADAELLEGEIVSLEPQTTTLGEAKLHHARVALAVVLAEGVDPAVVAPRAALLQDALIRELSTMDADGVRSSEGSDALRQRLSADAKQIWEEDEVIRVVLTELLVQ